MRQKALIALIALFLVLIALPGALGALSISIPSSFTTEHNSVLNMPFNITNTGSNITDVMVTATSILNASETVSDDLADLNAGETSSHTIDYAIPAYTAVPATYQTTINVSGNDSGISVSISETVNIVVSESKAWTVSSPGVITTSPGASSSKTFTIKNTGNVDLTNIDIYYNTSDPQLEDDDDDKMTLSFSPASISTLTPGETKTITVTTDVPEDMDIDEYYPKLYVNSTQLAAASQEIIVNVKLSFCEEGRQGTKIEVTIKEPDSGDDFYPSEIIPIDVKVRNRDDDDIDVVIVAKLFDVDEGEWLDAEVEQEVEIEEESSESFSLDLEIPADVTKKNDYRLYVKAYEDGEEDTQCQDKYVSIDIKQNTHDMKIDKVETVGETTCDSSFDIMTRLANVGTKDEDDVKLQITNSELSINEEKTVSIDEGDKKRITTSITIPKDAEEKTYTFNIKAFFHYYSNSYHDSVSTTQQVKVEGNCIKEETAATISTELLTAEPKTEEQLSIKLTVFNTGDLETSYTIAVSGYEGWAALDKIDPLVLTLGKDKAGTSHIYLTPNENTSGTQTVTVKALYDNKKTEKDITLEIKEKVTAASKYQGFVDRLKNLSGFDLATINIILVVAVILIVAWILKVKRAY